jgi:hypothetical protein
MAASLSARVPEIDDEHARGRLRRPEWAVSSPKSKADHPGLPDRSPDGSRARGRAARSSTSEMRPRHSAAPPGCPLWVVPPARSHCVGLAAGRLAEVAGRPVGLRLRQACAPPGGVSGTRAGRRRPQRGRRRARGRWARTAVVAPFASVACPSTTPEAAPMSGRRHSSDDEPVGTHASATTIATTRRGTLFSPRRREGREDPRRSGPAPGRTPSGGRSSCRPLPPSPPHTR